MLKIISEESVIRKNRQRILKNFKPLISETLRVELGHHGGALKRKISWMSCLGIWMSYERKSKDRFVHIFGVGKPKGISPISITCEINLPMCGVDRRLGGALAEDIHGSVFVVHRGKIGGSKKGGGKSFFEDNYRGVWAFMEDALSYTKVAVVGALDSPRFARQIAQFVRKVEKIKEAIASPSHQLEISFDNHDFREEIAGFGYEQHEPEDLVAACDRELVISDLNESLKSFGFKAANDNTKDLFLVNNAGKITDIFQISPDSLPSSLYAGVARVLLNSVDVPGSPRKFLVAPTGFDFSFKNKLKKLGLTVLEYEWQEDRAVFPRLYEAINSR